MKIEHILVISDQQDKEQKALARAKLMVERHGAKLHIVAFSYEHLQGLSASLSKEQMVEAQKQILLSHNKWLNKQIVKHDLEQNATSEVLWEKNISAWLKQHCKLTSYDLIIKTGHRSEGPFYTPTDWHILRNGLVPVLLVAEKRWRRKQAIMVALDMATRSRTKQALNQKLVDAGIKFSTSMQMPLHFCFSVPISPILKDIGFIDTTEAVQKARKKYIPRIQKMVGDHPIPVENIHINDGEAEKVIPSTASDIGASLVIIGTVGRKGLKAKLLGNTAEEVLTLLKTNILVIQP
ncbi:universal stress protein [Neptunicella sp. SCSIO 80796]|uniref:universal stress protein n=1 Tax=Neptunicella plasticusilytica TaxID=3117012 RepID=UPI003A4D638D